MLTRIRDEAHRFAITFQKNLMRRRNFQSVLEEIPGVGEVRKKALLRHFGSLKRVREAGIEELATVEGLGAEIAERIHTYLHGTAQERQAQSLEDATGDAVRSASLEDAQRPGSDPNTGQN
jgi:excinuclease ABC subunit C